MITGSILNDNISNHQSLTGLKQTSKFDKIFKWIIIGASIYTLFILSLIVFSVGDGSKEIFSKEGLGFITGTDWNAVPGRESFGALPYIIGTLVSSGIAMLIGVPISLAIAIFLSEIAGTKLKTLLSFVIELLAAVPSIIYGFWALFVFRFWMVDYVEKPLHNLFGGTLPFFAKTPFGLDVFTAGVVLAIMIIPIVSSIIRELLQVVPDSQREAAYSLGATRYETTNMAVLPYIKSGIIGATIIGLGRAIGETMLVTLIIGNTIGLNAIPTSLFSQSQTLSSLIANEFNEASSDLHLSALIGLGAVLLILAMAINVVARAIVFKTIKIQEE
ncbi:MAG TPA: phosphate ABC transporter permease subunit PstC [Nitrososphaeraceae archaeon]|nr:phosphate ABC transporter permease subunit PstC [Nitrososphaeraceae archaeon]